MKGGVQATLLRVTLGKSLTPRITAPRQQPPTPMRECGGRWVGVTDQETAELEGACIELFTLDS